jgi:hypothetical protein
MNDYEYEWVIEILHQPSQEWVWSVLNFVRPIGCASPRELFDHLIERVGKTPKIDDSVQYRIINPQSHFVFSNYTAFYLKAVFNILQPDKSFEILT